MSVVHALLLLNGLLVLCTALLGYLPVLGRYAGTLICPLLALAVINGVFTADFLAAYQTLSHKGALQISNIVFNRPEGYVQALAYFTGLHIAMLTGLGLALGLYRKRQTILHGWFKSRASLRQTRMAGLILLAALALALPALALMVQTALAHGSPFYVSAIRQLFYKDHPILWVGVLFTVPTLAVYLSRHQKLDARGLIAFCAVLITILLVGSRNQLFFLLFILLLLLHERGWRLPGMVYAPGIVVALGLSIVLRWLQRDQFVYDSFTAMLQAHGGVLQMLFATPEIALADTLTVLVSAGERFARVPFESVAAFVLFPIPRALIPFKPFGASTEFTSLADPERWQTFGSEITVTGYGDLFMQFGALGAAPFMVLAALIWGTAVVRVANARNPAIRLLWLPYLVWWAYVFVRTDLYIMAFSVWPLLLVLLVARLGLVFRFKLP